MPLADVVTVTLIEKGKLLSGASTGSSDAPISVPVDGDTKAEAEPGTFGNGNTVTLEMNNKGTAPTTADVEPKAVFDFSATDADGNPVNAEKSLNPQLPISEDEQPFGYSSSSGYQPLAYSAVTEENQSLSMFALDEKRARKSSTKLVKISVPAGIVNGGVVVVAESKRGSGGPSPTPTATPAPPEEAKPVTPKEDPPATPTNFKVGKQKPTSSKKAGNKSPQLVATWSPARGATGYELIITTTKKKIVRKMTIRASDKPSVAIPKLKKGTYTLTLRATNSAGSSSAITQKLKL